MDDMGDGSLKDTVMSSMIKEFQNLKEKFKNDDEECAWPLVSCGEGER
jgi:hypothetical protein